MHRRNFLTYSASLLLPHEAKAQQEPRFIPLIGRLPSELTGVRLKGFLKGVQSVAGAPRVHTEWFEAPSGNAAEALTLDLKRKGADVLVVYGNFQAQAVVRAAGGTPVIFVVNLDPVRLGLVDKISRRSMQVTGFTLSNIETERKRLEILHEALPSAQSVAYLFTGREERAQSVSDLALEIGINLRLVSMHPPTFDDAISGAVSRLEGSADALIIAADDVFSSRFTLLANLTLKHRIPSITGSVRFARAGGLLAYGPNLNDIHEKVGAYAAMILRGQDIRRLPVQRPHAFDLAVNLQTAATLGVNIAGSLIAQSSEVID